MNEVGDINNIHHHIKVTNFQDTSKDMLQDRNGYPIITGQVINKVNPNRGTYWLNKMVAAIEAMINLLHFILSTPVMKQMPPIENFTDHNIKVVE